jgi:hypothetical protein
MNQPGQILRAKVAGRKAEVYITLSFLDVDGKPRYRYAPGHKKAHEVIEKTELVEILGAVERFGKKK